FGDKERLAHGSADVEGLAPESLQPELPRRDGTDHIVRRTLHHRVVAVRLPLHQRFVVFVRLVQVQEDDAVTRGHQLAGSSITDIEYARDHLRLGPLEHPGLASLPEQAVQLILGDGWLLAALLPAQARADVA